jgi:hypothetical protein
MVLQNLCVWAEDVQLRSGNKLDKLLLAQNERGELALHMAAEQIRLSVLE